MGFAPKVAFSLLLAAGLAVPAFAQDTTPPPPPDASSSPESGALPPPPDAAGLPPPPDGLQGTPETVATKTIGDWALNTYQLGGPDARLCVVSRTYPTGERLGFIIGKQGNGFLYGSDKADIKEGGRFDLGFSVDDHAPIGLDAVPYDAHAVMNVPAVRPDGDQLLDVFARGHTAAIASRNLSLKSTDLSLDGAGKAIDALRGCARNLGIQTNAVSVPAAKPGTAPPLPPKPGVVPTQGQAPAVAPKAEEAIKAVIADEAKKQKAGVGVAVTMPKDVTGDNVADAVIVFTLLQGSDRVGYAAVLKTIGENKFKRMNTVPLGGEPTNDPPIFTDTGFTVTVRTPDGSRREVEVVVSNDTLSVK